MGLTAVATEAEEADEGADVGVHQPERLECQPLQVPQHSHAQTYPWLICVLERSEWRGAHAPDHPCADLWLEKGPFISHSTLSIVQWGQHVESWGCKS